MSNERAEFLVKTAVQLFNNVPKETIATKGKRKIALECWDRAQDMWEAMKYPNGYFQEVSDYV